MSKEEKKTISFGFSKLQKAPIIGSKLPPKSDDAVQFIDCLENKSIKVKNEEPKKSVLVIPLNKPDSHSIVQSRIVGRQVKSKESTNDASASESSCNDLSSKTQTSTSENATENLDQLAAKEILEDLKKSQEKKEEKSTFSVPLSSAPVSEKESTLDDYDNIPITEFGLAMLRGMGWKPGKGIGKNEKLVTAKPPVLRPKGLGLGADKVIQPEKTSETKEEVLKLVKGSYIRIIAGSHKDLFGEIMGFDEETGRLIAKMAISGSVLTFNEFMVKAVNKEEYNKNSKVLNVKKYEEFKKKENAGEDPNDIIESMKNKASRSDSNVSSSRHTSDSRRRGKSDVVEDSSLHNRRDRYKESRNRSDRQRSNSHSDNDSSSRRSHAKDRRYEKRRSSSDSDSNIRRQKYSKLDRTNTESKRNWKTKENRSDSSEEDSDYEKHKHRRGKRSSSLSDEENERSKKKKYRTSHHSSEGKRKKKSRQASSSAEEEEEEDNSHRRRKNDKEDTKKVSKSVRDHKSHRVDSSYSKDKNKSKKASRKYSNSSDSSSSEEENIRSSKKNKKRHKKKHYRSRSRS